MNKVTALLAGQSLLISATACCAALARSGAAPPLTLTETPPLRYGATVYYCPFDTNPYIEINEFSIGGQFDLTSCVKGHVDEVLKLLKADPGNEKRYHGLMIRLEVALNTGETYFMNAGGEVKAINKRKHRASFYHLPKARIDALHKLLLSLVPHE